MVLTKFQKHSDLIKNVFEKRNEDDEDINKLYGFSYGVHHKNSLRFSWKPDFNNKGMIKVSAYWIDFVKPKFTWGYFLFPYFGGNNTAANNMTITIK